MLQLLEFIQSQQFVCVCVYVEHNLYVCAYVLSMLLLLECIKSQQFVCVCVCVE